MLRGGLVLWLSAVAEDVLSQATDAQERYENQEDDDKDPEGAREEPKGLPLVFWAACVTTTLKSFRAGAGGGGRGQREGCWYQGGEAAGSQLLKTYPSTQGTSPTPSRVGVRAPPAGSAGRT